ncbi:uncharacterized protein A4U43_C05F33010 [Asparagus officinalis]|uniref:Uncharacterized protein n=1 Tax=Asparagus officinalis TaxID=4686 RepID=A0A5P1F0P7_ASPOF|nr:uncharacterized protein A4U43_C05F33010 [Asparagus officinalis]
MAGSMEMTAGMEPTEKARSWVDLWVRASRARVRCGWPRVREMREPSTGRPLGPRSWVCPIWVRLFSASTSAAPPAPPSVPTSCSYSCKPAPGTWTVKRGYSQNVAQILITQQHHLTLQAQQPAKMNAQGKEIALKCIYKSADARPTMSQVAEMIHSLKEEDDRSVVSEIDSRDA